MTPAGKAPIALFPEAPRHAMLWLDATWRFSRDCPDGRSLYGADCPAGAALADVMPTWCSSPLGRLLLRVQETRERTSTVLPSVTRPGRHLWARVSPTPDGGVRVALRFLKRAPKPHASAAQRFGALVGPLLLATYQASTAMVPM